MIPLGMYLANRVAGAPARAHLEDIHHGYP
jgi:hypothetical protein